MEEKKTVHRESVNYFRIKLKKKIQKQKKTKNKTKKKTTHTQKQKHEKKKTNKKTEYRVNDVVYPIPKSEVQIISFWLC